MTTKWAFIAGFVLAKSVLAIWILLHVLKLSDELLSTTLIGTFATINTAMGAAVIRSLNNSVLGGIPFQRALNGGATQHLVEHPEKIPEAIVQASIQRERQNGNLVQ